MLGVIIFDSAQLKADLWWSLADWTLMGTKPYDMYAYYNLYPSLFYHELSWLFSMMKGFHFSHPRVCFLFQKQETNTVTSTESEEWKLNIVVSAGLCGTFLTQGSQCIYAGHHFFFFHQSDLSVIRGVGNVIWGNSKFYHLCTLCMLWVTQLKRSNVQKTP